jgi:hypothetical protein
MAFRAWRQPSRAPKNESEEFSSGQIPAVSFSEPESEIVSKVQSAGYFSGHEKERVCPT